MRGWMVAHQPKSFKGTAQQIPQRFTPSKVKGPPIVLTIAGSDSSGGAGIQADLKTFTALGVYGASVITALTAQNTKGVLGIHPVPPSFVSKQFQAVTSDLDVVAVKIGMLGTAQVSNTIINCLATSTIPTMILDPVMVATSGDKLLNADAIDLIKSHLMPMATLITPNRTEAARLTGSAPFKTHQEMAEQAKILLNQGANAVLIKGGDFEEKSAFDLLVTHEDIFEFDRPRIDTQNTHGTGCTLSSAITAYMAKGYGLIKAVEAGKDYVWQALFAARQYEIGQGHGPLEHAYTLRDKA